MSEAIDFFIPDTPPSLNKVGARGGWRSWQTAKIKWQRDFETWLMATSMPRGCTHARVDMTLRFPVRRRRDRGNFQALLDKSVADALVNGGWLPDDTPEFYEFGSLAFDPEVGPPRTSVTVTYLRRPDTSCVSSRKAAS